MSTHRFYPYRAEADRILLTVEPVRAEIPCASDGTLLLYKTDLESVKLRVSAAVPAGIADQLVPPTEAHRPPLEVCLVCQSVESRKRSAQVLPGDGLHEGEITFRRNEWAGLAELRAFLVRTKRNSQQPAGFAADRGSALAWSRPLKVLFDEPPPHPGQHLDIQWESFSTSGDAWRRRNADQLFALDNSRDPPVLFLNRDLTGAYRILNSDAPHGKTARVRDATNLMLAHQVWTSLLATALAALAPYNADGGDSTPEDKLAELKDWQAGILYDWSRYLYPECDPQTALERVVSAAGDMVRTGEVMGRLGNAIQSRFSSHLGFQKLWEALDGA
jgi:hypothetical protein